MNPLLSVRGVSKRYEIYERPLDRLKQFVVPRLEMLLPGPRRIRSYYKEFWALRDVSLELGRGEALGILGRNGAGKSTLLQIVAGTLEATSGTVSVEGKVAALLELGSGFSPEFTGRENLALNATLLGLSSAEIARKHHEIEAFADIGDFIEQPVKTYSTGMVLRLAFAVQTAIEPELLIVDEALAVGDARFQKKCFARLEQLRARGTTILLVTHDTSTIVQFCTRAIILEQGRIFAAGEPKKLAREYHKLLFGGVEETPALEAVAAAVPSSMVSAETERQQDQRPTHEVRYGSGEAQITEVGLRDASGDSARVIETHSTCEAYFRAIFRSLPSTAVAYGFIISTAKGLEVYGTKSGLYSKVIRVLTTESLFECRLRFVVRLVPGRYFLTAALAHDDDRLEGQFLDYRFDALEFQVIGTTRSFSTSIVDLDGSLSHVELERPEPGGREAANSEINRQPDVSL
jgi:lipopolysaccharide transport system ATP-binding protein